MKNRILKIMGIVMTIAMLASFMVVGSPVTAAGGPTVPSINEWEGVVLPSTVPGSDVDLIEQAKDGTIFISVYFANATTYGGVAMGAGTWAMFKSTNGYTWTLTNINNQATRITAIEPSDNYANDKKVYVAIDTSATFQTTIFKCTNGAAVGTPYTELGKISAGEHGTTPAVYVYYIDSYFDGTDVWLLVSTDIDVFAIPDDGKLTTYWTDMDLSQTLMGDYGDGADFAVATPFDFAGVEVFMAKFAPDYGSSGVIWAVYYDEFTSAYIDAAVGAAVSGSMGYGIISRHSGSTLWGNIITPVIIDATVTTGVLTAIATVAIADATTAVYLPGCTNADGDETGITVDVGTTGAVVGTMDYAADTQTVTITWGTTPTAAGDIDVDYTGYTGGLANPFCDIEFSAVYNSSSAPELYAALSFSGAHGAGLIAEDDIYRVECGFWGAAGNVSQFDVDPTDRVDFCSLEVYGNVIIAGAYEAGAAADTPTEVWYSVNNGTSWQMASKNPTGELASTCRVLISKFGTTVGLAFAATSGTQSAVSISDDNGDTWMQTAFIDDVIDSIVDIAFNPTSKAALMITSNGTEDSLWKVADVTTLTPFWQRTLTEGYSTTIAGFTMVEYSNDGVAIMLYSNNAVDTLDIIYRSTNDTRTFSNWRNTASWGTINAWVVPNSSTVYAAATGFWSTALVGSRLSGETLVSIAISGDALVVGNNDGGAFASINKGNTWGSEIDTGAATLDTFVAFDAMYATNKLFYYANELGYVGKVLLDGNNQSLAANSNVELLDGKLLDGTNDDAGLSSAYAIICADDNALYVAGEMTTLPGSVTNAAVGTGGILQIIDDVNLGASGVLTFAADADISGIVGAFEEDEVLIVIGDSLVVDAGGTTVSGAIQVMGVTSGATGYVVVDAMIIGSLTGTFTALDTISITSSYLTLVSSETTSGSSDEQTTMRRLLLHQTDNNWEGPVTQLDDMSGLWYSKGSNILWTIVNSNTLFVFEDFLSGQTQGVNAVEIGANPENEFKTVKVSWTHMNEDDTTVYLISASWVIGGVTFTDYFNATVLANTPAGTIINTNITGLLAYTEYTFKVRVADDSPIQSRWSNAAKVTTGAYLYAPLPISPVQGQPQAATTSLNPTFTWGVVTTAVSYDFQLSDSATFATLIDSQNLAVTGYTYLGDGLAYDTDYYWRVRAVAADGSKSTWSSYSIIDLFGYYTKTGAPTSFHTMVDPEEYQSELTVTQTIPTVTLSITQTVPTMTIPVPEFTVTVPAAQTTVTTATLTVDIPDPATPVYIWIIVAIGALLTIAVIILIIRTRRVV